MNLRGRKKSLFIFCFISSTIGGTVSTLLAVYLPVIMSELNAGISDSLQADVSAYLNASFIFGWMAGGIFWGFFSDRAGRKPAFVYATGMYGVFTVATALSTSWEMIGLCRFFSGFGIGGVLVTTTILISENFDRKQRAVLLGILSISIPVGIFSAGLINYLLPVWRYAFAIGLLPVGVAVLSFFALADDPIEIRQPPATDTVSLETSGISMKNLLLGSLVFGTALIGLWATFSWLPSWIQAMLPQSDGQKERGMGMMLMGGGGLIGGFVSGWMVHRIGVKNAMLICFAFCFGLSWVLFRATQSFTPWVYTGIAALAFFFGISQGALSVYIPSLFPLRRRATATGICFNVGRLFTATSVFFIGSWVIWLGGYGRAIFIFSFVFLIGFFVTLISPSKHYLTQHS